MSAEFTAAAEKVKTLKTEPDQDEKLKLYGYFKQGSQNPAYKDAKKPGMMDFVGKAKYKAWTKVAEEEKLTPEQAQEAYIKLVEELVTKYGTQ